MPTVVFILPTGESRPVDVAPGTTLMNAAVKNGVDGIIGECGGVCMCATCHIYVREDFLDKLPAIHFRHVMVHDHQINCIPLEKLDAERSARS